MTVQYEVPQFMSSVQAAPFATLERVQKNVRDVLVPEGEGVNILGAFRQRENSNTVRLQQVNHVADWLLDELPELTNCFGCGFRLVVGNVRDVRRWQGEALAKPCHELNRQTPSP